MKLFVVLLSAKDTFYRKKRLTKQVDLAMYFGCIQIQLLSQHSVDKWYIHCGFMIAEYSFEMQIFPAALPSIAC